MTVNEIKKTVNQYLSGEMLTYKQLIAHLNWAVDDMNTQLNAQFPVFTEDTTEYTAIPDRYIRTVLVAGAVWHFYIVDEEGMSQAVQFQSAYSDGMFYMLRDYAWQIPEEYQADSNNGSVTADRDDRTFGEYGMDASLSFDCWG